MTPAERAAVVAASLAEVTDRARELIALGIDPREHIEAAAAIVMERRLADAMRLYLPEAERDVLVHRAGDTQDAYAARRAYERAETADDRIAAHERLLALANRRLIRRGVARATRMLRHRPVVARRLLARHRAGRRVGRRVGRARVVAARADDPPGDIFALARRYCVEAIEFYARLARDESQPAEVRKTCYEELMRSRWGAT